MLLNEYSYSSQVRISCLRQIVQYRKKGNNIFVLLRRNRNQATGRLKHGPHCRRQPILKTCVAGSSRGWAAYTASGYPKYISDRWT